MSFTPLGNQLLDRLVAPQYSDLLLRSNRMRLESGQVLYQSRSVIEYSYFPTSGTLSSVVVCRRGR